MTIRALATVWCSGWLVLLAGCASETAGVGSVSGASLLTVEDCPEGFNIIIADPTQVLIEGTRADDCIVGNGLDNVIDAKGGNDFIIAGAGDDTVEAGTGNDVVHGEDGDDFISGGPDNDNLFGGNGNDIIEGGSGNDGIDGGPGQDELNGGAGDDVLDGGEGDDTIQGGSGSDIVRGGDGSDSVGGGAGDDVVDGGAGDDTIEGGGGSDFLSGGGGDDDIAGGGANMSDAQLTVVLNDPPHIENLTVSPSKFVTTCEIATINVVASDESGDPIDYVWLIEQQPTGSSVSVVPTGTSAGFSADTVGDYQLRVDAIDPHGGRGSLSIPLHVSECP